MQRGKSEEKTRNRARSQCQKGKRRRNDLRKTEKVEVKSSSLEWRSNGGYSQLKDNNRAGLMARAKVLRFMKWKEGHTAQGWISGRRGTVSPIRNSSSDRRRSRRPPPSALLLLLLLLIGIGHLSCRRRGSSQSASSPALPLLVSCRFMTAQLHNWTGASRL